MHLGLNHVDPARYEGWDGELSACEFDAKDMLDTGIDVPEVVNLVIFKLVRPKTKFWQTVGRGTRLCPDLFAPGKSKEFFCIFDYCQNPEYFSENPEAIEGASGESLGKRLFKTRLELDPEAAKLALAGFMAGKALSANQIEFVNLIVDHLTEHGAMEPLHASSTG